MTLTNREVFAIDPTESDIPNDGVAKVRNPEDAGEWETLEWELRSFVCEGEYERGLERILDSSSATSSQARAAGGVGERLLRQRQVAPRARPRVPLARLRAAGGCVGARPRHPAGGDRRATSPSCRLPASARAGCGRPPARWRRARRVGAARLPLGPVRARRPAGAVRARPVHDLVQERGHLRRRCARRVEADGQDARQGDPRPLRLAGDRQGAARRRRQPRRHAGGGQRRAQDAVPDGRRHHRRRDVRRHGRRPAAPEHHRRQAAAHARRARRDAAVHRRRQREGARGAEHRRRLLGPVREPGARRRHRPDRADRDPDAQKLIDRFSVTSRCPTRTSRPSSARSCSARSPTRRRRSRRRSTRSSGEIDRHLGGTQLEAKAADKADLVADYPLLPTRRRFWERALRAIDQAGKAGVLRTQLKIVHEAARSVADQPLGHVIGGDFVFRSESAEHAAERRAAQGDRRAHPRPRRRHADGELKSRACALVFLISQLPARRRRRDRAARHRAVPRRPPGRGPRRRRRRAPQARPRVLDELVDQGRLMKLDDEFRLQTEEGAEWEKEFNQRRAAIRDDAARMTSAPQRVAPAGGRRRSSPGSSSSTARARRRGSSTRHWGDDEPTDRRSDVPVWIRDEWSVTEATVREAAAAAGDESPIVFVLLPKLEADQIKDTLASYAAAKDTVSQRPEPQTDEGSQAKQGMQTRVLEGRATARESVRRGRRQGEGLPGRRQRAHHQHRCATPSRPPATTPSSACSRSSAPATTPTGARSSPRRATAPRRARGRSASTGEVTTNPVCKEVLARTSGAGTKGSELQRDLGDAPYGWPKDAVNGALSPCSPAATSGPSRTASRSTAQGASGDPDRQGHLLQGGRAAHARRSGSPCEACSPRRRCPTRPGKEGAAISGLLQHLIDLAARAGGPPPLPEPPDTRTSTASPRSPATSSSGPSPQHAEQLRQDLKAWSAAGEQRAEREAAWRTLERLLGHAAAPRPSPHRSSAQRDAIETDRLLWTTRTPSRR